MSFRFRFFLGRAVWATSWRKTPKLVLTGCFSVSAQTSLKRYIERLLLFELSSSLSRIDDVFVNFREKKVTTRTLHWDAKTSFHLHTVAYDHARTGFARTSSPRTLSICWLCFGSVILGACACCIHPFSGPLSMLGSHRDQWEACAAAWRFVHCLAIVEGGKTTDARGSSSSPSRPRKAPKCVRREYVLSVSLRFHGFCSWQNRNCQSEYCLSRRYFFFNRKLDMSFSEADRMELDSTYSSWRKWDFLPGSFREGRSFDWRSMAIYRFVMTWKKI